MLSAISTKGNDLFDLQCSMVDNEPLNEGSILKGKYLLLAKDSFES